MTEQSRDDSDEGWGELPDEAGDDREESLRRHLAERPPHWQG